MYHAINIEINFSFHIKSFTYITKKLGQKQPQEVVCKKRRS